jgi:hypothetical protein
MQQKRKTSAFMPLPLPLGTVARNLAVRRYQTQLQMLCLHAETVGVVVTQSTACLASGLGLCGSASTGVLFSPMALCI